MLEMQSKISTSEDVGHYEEVQDESPAKIPNRAQIKVQNGPNPPLDSSRCWTSPLKIFLAILIFLVSLATITAVAYFTKQMIVAEGTGISPNLKNCTKVYPKSDGSVACAILLKGFYVKQESIKRCKDLDAAIPYIFSNIENELISDVKPTDYQIWIDAERDHNNEWTSSLGFLPYRNWADGEPTNGWLGNECVAMGRLSSQWNDVYCGSKEIKTVCERIISPPVSPGRRFHVISKQVENDSDTTLACNHGKSMLSCGFSNLFFNIQDYKRSFFPTTEGCRCISKESGICKGLCGPVEKVSIEMKNFISEGFVHCNKDQVVLGCHTASPLTQLEDFFEDFFEDYLEYLYTEYDFTEAYYPMANGSGCICTNGGLSMTCVASCGAQIKNYEIVKIVGTHLIEASCPIDKNLLGCGIKPHNVTEDQREFFQTIEPYTTKTCRCYNYYGMDCFAICGTI